MNGKIVSVKKQKIIKGINGTSRNDNYLRWCREPKFYHPEAAFWDIAFKLFIKKQA